MSISTKIYGVGHHNSSLVKGVKCVLHEMGIITSETLAAPRVPFNESDRETVRQRLKELV